MWHDQFWKLLLKYKAKTKYYCNTLPVFQFSLCGDFGGYFFNFDSFLILLGQVKIDVLPIVEALTFAVSTIFRFQIFFCIII